MEDGPIKPQDPLGMYNGRFHGLDSVVASTSTTQMGPDGMDTLTWLYISVITLNDVQSILNDVQSIIDKAN